MRKLEPKQTLRSCGRSTTHACYMELRTISPTVAAGWRRYAWEELNRASASTAYVWHFEFWPTHSNVRWGRSVGGLLLKTTIMTSHSDCRE